MAMIKLLQVKISQELYNQLVLEAINSGLSVSQVARLKLSNKKIVGNELEKDSRAKYRPIQTFRD